MSAMGHKTVIGGLDDAWSSSDLARLLSLTSLALVSGAKTIGGHRGEDLDHLPVAINS